MERRILLAFGTLAFVAACASSGGPGGEPPSAAPPAAAPQESPAPAAQEAPSPRIHLGTAAPPSPDPREGLAPGLLDAQEAFWNLRKLSTTPPPRDFVGMTNSDLAFTGNLAIQGNYNGVMIWDISTPASPTLVSEILCPASQSDVSVYGDLLFVSGEGMEGRLDCGTQGVNEAVSPDRLRGIRIFDISDPTSPRYIHNVQACRGSHTHTVLQHPGDDENVYVYVSGSAPIRPAAELPGCVGGMPDENPETALFRIEVIQVPLADPTQAAIVSSPRIFDGLTAPPRHGPAPADLVALEEARERGAFILDLTDLIGEMMILPDEMADDLLRQFVQMRGGSGAPTAADSTALRERLPLLAQGMMGDGVDPNAGPNQCHDITVFPEAGIAGGACEGYGILLDIRDPVNPVRLDAVADSNFAYWHSATFNNDGTTVIFTDEWGGGGAPKCRDTDPPEWGANALFSVEDGRLRFRSYFKIPAAQTEAENCVAHNGSLIPVPGRDIKVQAWYQGGISVFDFTDPENPFEIAFHDRGPVDADRMEMAGSWSVYWHNGIIVSSEIARGLDIFELVESPHLTAAELEAARSVRFETFNPQGQPRIVWPATFARSRAHLDQLERRGQLANATLAEARQALDQAEGAQGSARTEGLRALAGTVRGIDASGEDARLLALLATSLEELAGG